MAVYTLIAGVNGVGKSSFAGLLLSQNNDLGIFIDTDKKSAALGGELQGGRWAVRQIRDCLEKGISFAQETTLSGRQPLQTILRAHEQGYAIHLHYIGLDSLEDSLERIANRVRRGGHSIPEETVRHRFHKRFQDLKKILPYCQDARFYDNNNGFQRIAQWQNGFLVLQGDLRPAWILELRQILEN